MWKHRTLTRRDFSRMSAALVGGLITGRGNTFCGLASDLTTYPLVCPPKENPAGAEKVKASPFGSTPDFRFCVEWKELPGSVFLLSLPEAIGTLADASGTFRYVMRMKWKSEKAGRWTFKPTYYQQRYSNSEPFLTTLGVRAHIDGSENLLSADFAVRNDGLEVARGVYLWVCTNYAMAPSLSPASFAWIGERAVSYQEKWPKYFGPAGMRCYTELGKNEILRLSKIGLVSKSVHVGKIGAEESAAPFRAAQGEASGKKLYAATTSPQAAILGGYDTNPCIDMALSFGDIEPGRSVQANYRVLFGTGSLEDAYHKLLQS